MSQLLLAPILSLLLFHQKTLPALVPVTFGTKQIIMVILQGDSPLGTGNKWI